MTEPRDSDAKPWGWLPGSSLDIGGGAGHAQPRGASNVAPALQLGLDDRQAVVAVDVGHADLEALQDLTLNRPGESGDLGFEAPAVAGAWR
jgi:hypothetical protein